MRIRPWLITSVRTTVVIMLWIMIPKQAKCVRDKQRRDESEGSRTGQGLVWIYYLFTTYTKDKKYPKTRRKVYNFHLCDKNLPEDLVPLLDYDARTSRMNRVMPLLGRLPPFTNWTEFICRANVQRLLIRSWKAWAHPLSC